MLQLTEWQVHRPVVISGSVRCWFSDWTVSHAFWTWTAGWMARESCPESFWYRGPLFWYRGPLTKSRWFFWPPPASCLSVEFEWLHTRTNCMEQGPSWEVCSSSASQEIPPILLNLVVHYRIHTSPPLVLIQSSSTTLTEVFPCFFLSCKANARVTLAKTAHGPYSSKLVVIVFFCHLCCAVVIVLYCCYCDVL